MAHHKRRRRRRAGILGCCGMCMLRKTDGRRNSRLLTLQDKISLLKLMEGVNELGDQTSERDRSRGDP